MKPAELNPKQIEALRLVADGCFLPALVEAEDGRWFARWRPVAPASATAGTDPEVARWVDEYVRAANRRPSTAAAENYEHATLHDAWLDALSSRTGLVRGYAAECRAFAAALEEWARPAQSDGRAEIVFSIAGDRDGFRLACPRPRGESAYRALGEAAYLWGPLRNLRAAADPPRLEARLTNNEAEDFLRRGARVLKASGYGVDSAELAADIWLEAAFDESAGASADERGKTAADAAAASAAMRLEVRIAGEKVTAAEIRFLLEQNSSLVFFREHWIEVDRAMLKDALKALEHADGRKANPLVFAIGLGAVGRLEVRAAQLGGALDRLLSELRRNCAQLPEGLTPPGFAGTLREYQARGVAWIKFLTDRGFGALLADDMGLGKTAQTIAWMLAVRDGRRGPFLVVAPLTLLENWRRELAQFSPGLKVYVHQGEFRHLASGFAAAAAAADVVVTSYNLLVRDHDCFAETEWSALVLDEAQMIKNHDTQAARAVRALLPPLRLALTGTPIENSVADVWSIEEFLNPGLLGDRKSFDDRFTKPLKNDPASAAGRRLRRALEPFVLRRLKGDAAIASEIGDKRTIREYCELTAAQRSDYERELADYRAATVRRGDIFALITALKLVCDGAGKLERLLELADQLTACGESALVFTQYARVGAWLKKELSKHCGEEVPFLHGGLSAAERQRQIAAFNAPGPRLFVLSLKAGGYGLNLVKATHVIHFDRWWNPAVENQATDRAHRIGQDQTVFVHEFITVGTLEEHIDDILQRKHTLDGLLKDGEELWKAVALE